MSGQGPIVVNGINNIRQLPATALPISGTFLVEVQTPSGGTQRQKVPVSSLVSGALSGGGFLQESIAIGLTAAGTSQANGLALTAQRNIVATAASSAVGVILPLASTIGVGGWIDVFNDGPSNSFHVYGNAGVADTIDGTAGATGVVLTNAFWCRYLVTSLTSGVGTFVSYRSAIVRSA